MPSFAPPGARQFSVLWILLWEFWDWVLCWDGEFIGVEFCVCFPHIAVSALLLSCPCWRCSICKSWASTIWTVRGELAGWDCTMFEMMFFHSWVFGREWRMRKARVLPSNSFFILANHTFVEWKKAISSAMESPSMYSCSTNSILV